jgi:hypothetical protein
MLRAVKSAAEQRAALDALADRLTGAVRRAVIEPGENVIAIVERLAAQSYPLEVAQHLQQQLSELADGINYKLGDRAQRIERLGSSLSAFERRLAEMSKKY